MSGDAMVQLVESLSGEDLQLVRTRLEQILADRREQGRDDFLDFVSMSSLELVGLISIIDRREQQRPAGNQEPMLVIVRGRVQ